MITYTYQRELSSYFLVICGGEDAQNDYRTEMLEKNRMQGLLACQVKYIDGESRYYYDIGSRQTVRQVFSIRKMKYQDVRQLFYQIHAILRETEKYLLHSRGLILRVDVIYWDFLEKKILMVYYPPRAEDEERTDTVRLGEDLLELIDYEDLQAVELGHRFYELTRNENFVWDDVITEMENSSGPKDDGRKTMESTFPEQPMEEPERMAKGDETALEPKDREPERSAKDREPERSAKNREPKRSAKNREPERSAKNREPKRNAKNRKPECSAKNREPERSAKNWWSEHHILGKQYKHTVRPALLKRLLAAALLTLAAGYLWSRYIFTPAEIIAGALCILVIAGISALTLVRQNARVEEEEPAVPPLWEQESESTQEASAGTECGEEMTYGETVCLFTENNREERRLSGALRGTEITISLDSMPFVVGKLKDHVSYVLPELSVSRMHAEFEEENGKLWLSDLHSKNGTYKNEVRLETGEKLEVRPGDEIRFGNVKFTYH